MAKVNAQQLAFNRGEVSKIALARIDVAKLQLAAECQVNWMPWVLGPMSVRPGLQLVGEVLADAPAKILKFVYSKLDTSLIELTAGEMRVWINEVLLTRVAVGTAVSDPTFAGGGAWTTANTTAGCTATIAGGQAVLACTALGGLAQIQQSLSIAGGDVGKEHGLRITVSNGPVTLRVGSSAGAGDLIPQTAIDTGTHSIPFTPVGASAVIQIESTDQWNKALTGVSIEAAGVLTLPTTWGAGDLANIRYTQSGDIIYVACYGQQQRKIERRGVRPGARGWSFVLYRSGTGPFHSGPDTTATLVPGAMYGDTTITSNQPLFTPGHVGALLRMFTPGQTNQTVLGASNTYQPATRVSGVANVSRQINSVTVTGTWTGTISFQRSFTGPTSGFIDISTGDVGWFSAPAYTGNFSNPYLDDRITTGTGLGTAYDNTIVWYRLGFENGQLASGSATVSTGYNDGGRWGIARILGYVSQTQVNVEILQPFSSVGATNNWQISDWCPAFGFPTSVAFFEGRLWWFSGSSVAAVTGSQSDDYTGYAQEDQFGNPLGDAGAIIEAFGDGPSDTVNWGLPLTRLLCGREGSVSSIRSSSFDEVVTPTNFSAKDCTTQGANRLPPLKVDKRGVYVQQSNRRVYELEFDPRQMDYSARDLTRLNLDIGKPGFVDLDVSRQPDTQLNFVRADGEVASLLHDVDDEVDGWWRLMTLGVIENHVVLPQAGLEDLQYFVVRRIINGVTRRFIERLAPRGNCVGGSLNQMADCHSVYQGAPTTTMTLAQLPLTQVVVWADGAPIGTATTDGGGNFTMPDGHAHSVICAGLGGAVVTGAVTPFMPSGLAPNQIFSSAQGTLTVGTQYNGYPAELFADIGSTGKMIYAGSATVAGGVVALPNSQIASVIVACLGYVAPFMSAKLAYAAQGGSALAHVKKLDHVGLVLFDSHSQGLQYGQRFDYLDGLPLIEAGQATLAGTVWTELDAPMIELGGEWDTDARLCLLGQAPFPCMVGGAIVGVATNG